MLFDPNKKPVTFRPRLWLYTLMFIGAGLLDVLLLMGRMTPAQVWYPFGMQALFMVPVAYRIYTARQYHYRRVPSGGMATLIVPQRFQRRQFPGGAVVFYHGRSAVIRMALLSFQLLFGCLSGFIVLLLCLSVPAIEPGLILYIVIAGIIMGLIVFPRLVNRFAPIKHAEKPTEKKSSPDVA